MTRRLGTKILNLQDMKFYYVLFFILFDFVAADIDKYDNNKEVKKSFSQIVPGDEKCSFGKLIK